MGHSEEEIVVTGREGSKGAPVLEQECLRNQVVVIERPARRTGSEHRKG